MIVYFILFYFLREIYKLFPSLLILFLFDYHIDDSNYILFDFLNSIVLFFKISFLIQFFNNDMLLNSILNTGRYEFLN